MDNEVKLEFGCNPPAPERACVAHKLKGDLIYRYWTVNALDGSDETWWEVEISHRLCFNSGIMKFKQESDAIRIYNALGK